VLLNTVLAGIMGTMLGLGLDPAAEMLNRRVRSESDVARRAADSGAGRHRLENHAEPPRRLHEFPHHAPPRRQLKWNRP
jgi:hypothetical protein